MIFRDHFLPQLFSGSVNPGQCWHFQALVLHEFRRIIFSSLERLKICPHSKQTMPGYGHWKLFVYDRWNNTCPKNSVPNNVQVYIKCYHGSETIPRRQFKCSHPVWRLSKLPNYLRGREQALAQIYLLHTCIYMHVNVNMYIDIYIYVCIHREREWELIVCVLIYANIQ